MKKRLIPATIAALAISLTSVVAPSAFAQTPAQQTYVPEITLDANDTERVTFGSLLDYLESVYDANDAFAKLESITFDESWLTSDYEGTNRDIIAKDAPAGEHTVGVTITFTDDVFDTVNGNLDVKINDVTKPVISPINTKAWEVNTPIDPITVQVSDETAVNVEVTGLPAGVTFNKETNTITGTPTEAATATSFTVTATDIDGNESTLPVSYSVDQDITKPVISDIADQEWVINSPITPIVVEVSEEADITVTGLPEGLNYDAGNKSIWGTPTELTEDPATVTINAEDTAENDATAVTFSASVVEAEDTAPVITPIADQDWQVGTAVNLDVSVTGDTNASVTGLPEGVSFDRATSKITGTPTELDTGTVTVTAEGAEDVSFDYTVTEAPDEGSSIDGSSGGAIGIAIAAVVAAIAAFLGAVGTGIIQLPPAIANLLPF